MPLAPGATLGPYSVTAKIGEGGMGEVYQARDTKLDRDVALKVLPEAFTADPDRLSRFEREARVLASLNHPNISGIHGIEDTTDTKALVLELVEGPTLADRIAQGAIPVDEALPIAKQIAEALEAAHEQGVIHRDLKPANVKVKDDGTVKVLDFGLAKALDPTPDGDPSQSPTLTAAATQMGVIMGTAAYMSPEQARGKTVDKRADIWAFGAVLFEMLTASRAFAGEDVSLTLSAVLQRDPAWSALPPDVPQGLGTYLRRCLQKDPRQRVRDMGDLRLALEGAFERSQPQSSAHETAPSSRRTATLVSASGLVGALVAAVALWPSDGPAPAPPAPVRLSVTLPLNAPVADCGSPSRSLALSPDGTQLVYVGPNLAAPAGERGTRLWLRSLASLEVRDLPGTRGPCQPFFSFNGQWVAFFTQAGELKKVSLAGGDPVTVAENINGARWGFGVWTEEDIIIFGTTITGLRQVSAEGGAVTDLTTLDEARDERFHHFPTRVPSSRAVLFTTSSSQSDMRIEAVTRESGERRVVVENARWPYVLESGHLLFQRDETLLVAPFDPTRVTVTGPAVPVVDSVGRDLAASPFPVAQLTVSERGTLAYLPPAETGGALGLVDREGAFEPLGPGEVLRPRVSPDGRAVAFIEGRGAESVVRIYDRPRGSTTRLSQEGREVESAWHPDGRSLAVSGGLPNAGIFLRQLDGTSRLIVPLPADATIFRHASWSPDGAQLAYTIQTGNRYDIWVLTMGDQLATAPFLETAADPAFSPDGRWLAYMSNESGRNEVYLQAYPEGEQLAISTDGGFAPVWSRDGREIFFAVPGEGGGSLMAVSVAAEGDTLALGRPEPLFDLRVSGPTGAVERYVIGSNAGPGYDVLPDGRFVMVRSAVTRQHEIVLVQNWFEELMARAPIP